MKAGIVGTGKMGMEIIRQFLSIDCELTIICITDITPIENTLKKELSRKLKRKLITEDEYNKKISTLVITADKSALSACDIIVETVFEDVNVKKQLFMEIESIVSDKCILCSNTSSLDINEVFSQCKNKSRCAGLHFFYPVKMSGFVEINTENFTEASTVKMLHDLILRFDKTPLIFSGNYNIYLNQAIGVLMHQAFTVKKKYSISSKRISDALTKELMLYGPFGLIDGIGINLLSKGADFKIPRIYEVSPTIKDFFSSVIEMGCDTAPGSYSSFMAEHESDDNSDSITDESICAETIIPILNESITASRECGYRNDILIKAVWDTLGITVSAEKIYQMYGYDKISSILKKYKDETGFSIYDAIPEEFYKFYCERNE